VLIRWHVKTVPEVAKTLKLGGSNCSRHRQHENEESEGQFQCLPGTSIDFTLPTSILVHLKPTAALRLRRVAGQHTTCCFFSLTFFKSFFLCGLHCLSSILTHFLQYSAECKRGQPARGAAKSHNTLPIAHIIAHIKKGKQSVRAC